MFLKKEVRLQELFTLRTNALFLMDKSYHDVGYKFMFRLLIVLSAFGLFMIIAETPLSS